MSNKLREIRVLRRISQYALALQTGIPQSRISIIENSLTQPTEEEKKKIAKVLGLQVKDIFIMLDIERT
ncbi:MAG: helix-turn-helix transcriptional regulator [Candidatus Kariarchaeaceae archaeon]|jgi:transcriptional regulator with XRE-family HTH domain